MRKKNTANGCQAEAALSASGQSGAASHAPNLRALCALCAVLLAGCAIGPRGPVVSHELRCYEGRADGLVREERWKDAAGLRAFYLFTDPSAQNIVAWHTNQVALGGCSHFSAGSVTIKVDTNTAAIIGAGGTAAGNIIGAAAKTAIK
jgi:hypothetical protein